ncbi:MBOAT family O-acyltransferase [Flagellimonas olearia]|uniref:MBOAT family O-acyltransferase n=1 Tax=Flagellimonas olearia TaxID=552546 RepID=UPI0028BE9E01|nr:MBOAT family O-acyltransferase [Allomuricauda olearia]
MASYIFYGWWDYRFLSLILFSTIVDYFVGLKMAESKNVKSKRMYLWISLASNLGLLGFFKYYNFFVDSFVNAFTFFGYQIENVWTLNIILPVGISFYTFQTLSYSLDIYKGKLNPTKDFISFSTFVAFFPQLVAGPIERATHLLPQIELPRKFCGEQQREGIKLMLWGLFKKVVIADSLAPIVDDIFMNSAGYPSSTLILGAIFFGFQIYGDFSGYSDIAIGTAKLFGVELMSNFKFPYFSRDIGEFWRRWHISLSTWFRDYLYIPLGGSRTSKPKAVRNIFIIFLVSGFWHGANWTFIFWGLFHAFLFVPLFYAKANRRYLDTPDVFESFKSFALAGGRIVKTFFLVTLGWVFFRSKDLSTAFDYLNNMLLGFTYEPYMHPRGYRIVDYIILLIAFIVFEYVIRRDERNPFRFQNRYIRFFIYASLVFLMLLFYDDGVDRSFIYFQF